MFNYKVERFTYIIVYLGLSDCSKLVGRLIYGLKPKRILIIQEKKTLIVVAFRRNQKLNWQPNIGLILKFNKEIYVCNQNIYVLL